MNVKEQRFIQLFNTTDYFALGTLWKIKNALWRKAIPNFVSKNDEGHHPAICLGKKNLTSLYQPVPMLLGSHSNKTGFRIRNFSENEKSKPGFFKIKPYYFSPADTVGAHRGIKRNEFKPRLTPDEIAELKKYLLEKGVQFDG